MTRAELDANLKQAIAVGTPVEVFDPTTHEVYYLLSAAQYQTLAATVLPEFDPRHGYSLIEKIMAEDDRHDPLLDSYQ